MRGARMSANGAPRRSSAAIRGFKIWFGGIFLTLGLVGLLAAITLYLVLGQTFGRAGEIWAFIAAPLGLGISFSVLGGTFVLLGVSQIRKEQRLREHGTTTEATVVEVEPTGTRVNGRRLWHVRYTYEDLHGATHRGESGHLESEDAQSYRIGETVFVLYDPASPATSAWLGRSDVSEQS
jgi:hypothetical protein